MKKYYYANETETFGPFTLEELNKKAITRETNVWFQELGDWKNAGEIQELQELFILTPPPIQSQNVDVKMPLLNRDVKISNTQISPIITFENYILISVVFWLIMVVAAEFSYIIPILISIIFSITSGVFALSIKTKAIKIIAIIISIVITILQLYFRLGGM